MDIRVLFKIFPDTIKNAYENFFDEFHSKHSNKNIVVKEEDKEQQQQQPLPEQQQQNVSTNNFTNFEQFRSILDSTPLKNLECEEMEEDEEERGRRRVSSLGEENLTFYSAESRKRFLSTSGTSEANNNVVFNNNKTPVRTTTTMLQKKINNLQQTPKTTATTNFSFNKLQTEKHCSQQQKQSRLLELQQRVADRRKWCVLKNVFIKKSE